MALIEKPEYVAEAGEGADGWPGDTVFLGSAQSLSFEDVIVLPGEKLPVGTSADIGVRFTRNVALSCPIACGPSASICGASMAITLALKGSLGIIHRHQSVQKQVEMVKRVKQYETGFILNPVTMSVQHTVADVDRIKAAWGVQGIPITENGRMGGKLLGLVTERDLESVEDRRTQLLEVMTTQVVVMREPVTLREARIKMQQTKVGKLPVVNEDGELVALICRGDLKRTRDHTGASRDANRQLLCGAACLAESQEDFDRALALIDAGVDLLVIDTDDGVTDFTVEMVKKLKEAQEHNSTDLLGGRITSLRQARELLEAGIDGLRIGDVSTDGPPNATTVYEITRLSRLNYGIPVVVDGARDISSMVKALFVGASGVMINSLLERTEEVPGDYLFRDGVRTSLQTCKDALDLAGVQASVLHNVSQQGALVNKVLDAGSARDIVAEVCKVMRKALEEVGVNTMIELHNGLFSGFVRFERRMPSFQELQILHGMVTKESQEPIQKVRLVASSLTNRW